MNCRYNLYEKSAFLTRHLEHNSNQKTLHNLPLIKYFDKYETFCFDLNSDSVLKGDLIFNYK